LFELQTLCNPQICSHKYLKKFKPTGWYENAWWIFSHKKEQLLMSLKHGVCYTQILLYQTLLMSLKHGVCYTQILLYQTSWLTLVNFNLYRFTLYSSYILLKF